ncbi:hypothetical protein E2C01_066297 [Portunus trituberculatus]|uniref:Uncharacterized protein n=1 Tax=Portunus trituberculatus TaxID=210409 RepID=A0A5B7HQN4_PORTR|nr:hypothetical protein [Portunus trituberculatus]
MVVSALPAMPQGTDPPLRPHQITSKSLESVPSRPAPPSPISAAPDPLTDLPPTSPQTTTPFSQTHTDPLQSSDHLDLKTGRPSDPQTDAHRRPSQDPRAPDPVPTLTVISVTLTDPKIPLMANLVSLTISITDRMTSLALDLAAPRRSNPWVLRVQLSIHRVGLGCFFSFTPSAPFTYRCPAGEGL